MVSLSQLREKAMRERRAKISDPAYAGYELAINKMPILINPDSMRRLSGISNLRPADAMRHIAHTHHNKSKEAKELQQKRIEARLAELEDTTAQEF